MRYVDEFLYNVVAELRLWRARRRAAGRGAPAIPAGSLTGAFTSLVGGGRAVPAGSTELDHPRP